MGRLSRVLGRALDFFHKKPPKRFFVSIVETSPSREDLGGDEFFLVQAGSIRKWAFFRCPCGCGDVLNLSLLEDRRPRWMVSLDFLSRPTLNPSVRREEGCYSHFWIR